MHAFFHTQAAQRRAKPPRSTPRATPAAAPRGCLMQLTVDAAAVTDLRALVMRTCGAGMEFMRVEACDHGARVKVWLCLSRALAGQVMEAVMRALPGAEFGRMTALAQRTAA
ncbi:hypothetical protein GTP56_28525 [Duganella sp. FT134W]|uniref:Uncharacterized protein n=2 Tax=Duganella margarita TaxID=2692170 RepID=A0A7X4H663_9BURK|nr:hypothetical protein [Duganella margarita]MYM76113.1 hypothetical protein [Duganella margarita]